MHAGLCHSTGLGQHQTVFYANAWILSDLWAQTWRGSSAVAFVGQPWSSGHRKTLAKCSNTDEITDAQVEELKAGKEKLMQSAQKLFAKMYEQAQNAQQAGPNPGANTGSQDSGNEAYGDDVVDGDYREV